jgi:hypothetical protein
VSEEKKAWKFHSFDGTCWRQATEKGTIEVVYGVAVNETDASVRYPAAAILIESDETRQEFCISIEAASQLSNMLQCSVSKHLKASCPAPKRKDIPQPPTETRDE